MSLCFAVYMWRGVGNEKGMYGLYGWKPNITLIIYLSRSLSKHIGLYGTFHCLLFGCKLQVANNDGTFERTWHTWFNEKFDSMINFTSEINVILELHILILRWKRRQCLHFFMNLFVKLFSNVCRYRHLLHGYLMKVKFKRRYVIVSATLFSCGDPGTKEPQRNTRHTWGWCWYYNLDIISIRNEACSSG